MFNRVVLFILVTIFVIACSQPKPRMPINHSSGYDQSSSIAFNKKLYSNEATLIEAYIKKDSTHQYINSQHGFWYTFINQIPNDTIMPIKGDVISMVYDVQDLYGNEIYSEKEIGNVTYRVDKEEIIKGIQEGIKWMNEGETVKFLFPSHKAFAYHGDEKKIGPNMPIVVNLKLVDIKN